MILRDYQLLVKERVYAAWESGCRSVMCQMPTGTGKTVVLSQIISDALAHKMDGLKGVEQSDGAMKVLVVAHRKEILEQIRDTLDKYGLGEMIDDGSVVVGSVQKITKTMDSASSPTKTNAEMGWGKPFLVVVDEAHHATAKTYRMLWEMFPEARFLGMTATPCRMKAEGFGDLFDTLVCSYPVRQFIENGWLADYDYVVIRPDGEMKRRIGLLKKRGTDGDYQQKELGSVMDNRACIEQLYESYKQYADGKHGIIYAINREHAIHIKEYYELRGESANVVDAGTPKKERERILEDYREGRLRILVNCNIYSEGYDASDVQFIQLARPTLSLSKYLQQVGRGLRPNADGSNTLILDNVGMYYMFGLPNADRDWQTMFREGQAECRCDLKAKNGNRANGYVHNAAAGSADDGHKLEMVLVNGNRASEGKVEIGRTWAQRQQYWTLLKNGNVVNPNWLFDEYHDFVDGVCWMKSQGETHTKTYFDDKGNFIVDVFKESRLLPDGFIEIKDKGLRTCYDARLGICMTCFPNMYKVGDAEFVELFNGWHLRNRNYASAVFQKDSIKQKGGCVFATSMEGEEYVIANGGRTVCRVLGQENDNTTVLWDVRYKNTLHLLQCNMFVALMEKQNPDLYRRWIGRKANLLNVGPLAQDNTYLAVGKDVSAYEDDGLFGLMVGREVVCKAQFKEIVDASLYDKCILVKNSNGRNVLVDKDGNVLYDRYEILRMDNGKLFIYADMHVLCMRNAQVFVDIDELLAGEGEGMLEQVGWNGMTFRVTCDESGTEHFCIAQKNKAVAYLDNMEDKGDYWQFEDTIGVEPNMIICPKDGDRFYYLKEVVSKFMMTVEDVETHEAFAFSFNYHTNRLEIRQPKARTQWGISPAQNDVMSTNERVMKFMQKYASVK